MTSKSASDRSEVHRDYGRWSLVDRPDHRVIGHLIRFSDDRQELQLVDRLVDAADDQLHRIAGIVGSGNYISLDECRVTNSDVMGVAPWQHWMVGRSVIGAELPNEEDWQFPGATMVVPGLTKWTRWNGIEVTTDLGEGERQPMFGVSATRVLRDLWEIDGIKVSFGTSLAVDGDGEDSRQLTARSDLVMKSEDRHSIERLHRAGSFPIQILIGLATGVYTAPTAAKVRCTDESGRSELLPTYWNRRDATFDARQVHRWGFTLGHLDQLNITLQAWAEKLQKIEAVADLYLALLGDGLHFGEVRFLLAAQALETYHRETRGGSTLPKEEWKCLLAHIRGSVASQGTSEAYTEIAERMAWLNEKSLSLRLRELLAQLGELDRKVAGEDPTEFARKVTATRNYFTHWSSSGNKAFPRGGPLFHATERLLAVLELLLIRDLGFALDSPLAKEILHRRISWLPAPDKTG